MKKQPPRQGRDFWNEHISRWKKSSLSQRAYCMQQNLQETTFSHWKRKLADSAVEPMKLVEILDKPKAATGKLPLKITIGGQLSIIVENDTDPDLLTRVVLVLRRAL